MPAETGLKSSPSMEYTRIKNYVAGFGEKTAKVKEANWTKIGVKVMQAAAFILGTAAIGFFVGNIIGAAIGAAIGTGVVIAAVFQNFLAKKMEGNRFLLELPQEGQHEVYKDRESGQLGHYYNADLRIAATADEGLEWKKKLIESAQKSIELSANFAGGSCFQEVLAILEEKMANSPQLVTHMLLSSDLIEESNWQKLNQLQERFKERFQLLVTDRHYRLNLINPESQENHVKMLVVDGKYFVSGGTGIHPRLSQENYHPEQAEKETPTSSATVLDLATRDMDIVGESVPLVMAMRKQFFNLYRLWEIRTKGEMVNNRYFSLGENQGHCQKFAEDEGLIKDVRLKFLVGGPEHRGNNPIVGEYARRILKAKEKVHLANLLFIPPKAIRDALIEARARDPEKKLIGYSNGIGPHSSIGKIFLILMNRGYYDLLDKVYEYLGPHRIYHRKMAIIDKKYVITGSSNIGTKSSKLDHEAGFVIKDERVAAICGALLKEDKKESKRLDREAIIQDQFWLKTPSSILKPIAESFCG